MIYQTDTANSENQVSEITSLSSILTALGPLATAANQSSGNTTLSSILTGVNALGGTSMETTLQAIQTALGTLGTQATLAQVLAALAPLATASNQATSNTTLASILSTLATVATSANQTTTNNILADMDSKMGSTVGTIISVSMTATSQVALPTNTLRRGVYLYNNSNKTVYVAYASSASTTLFTFPLITNSGYESPQQDAYRGPISVISLAGVTGNLLVTELQ